MHGLLCPLYIPKFLSLYGACKRSMIYIVILFSSYCINSRKGVGQTNKLPLDLPLQQLTSFWSYSMHDFFSLKTEVYRAQRFLLWGEILRTLYADFASPYAKSTYYRGMILHYPTPFIGGVIVSAGVRYFLACFCSGLRKIYLLQRNDSALPYSLYRGRDSERRCTLFFSMLLLWPTQNIAKCKSM